MVYNGPYYNLKGEIVHFCLVAIVPKHVLIGQIPDYIYGKAEPYYEHRYDSICIGGRYSGLAFNELGFDIVNGNAKVTDSEFAAPPWWQDEVVNLAYQQVNEHGEEAKIPDSLVLPAISVLINTTPVERFPMSIFSGASVLLNPGGIWQDFPDISYYRDPSIPDYLTYMSRQESPTERLDEILHEYDKLEAPARAARIRDAAKYMNEYRNPNYWAVVCDCHN